MSDTLQQLNASTPEERLEHLRTLIAAETKAPSVLPQYANNHIHTIYSFSPYSPTAAVYFARAAGLNTAGLMDHDSIAGAREFLQAGEIAGVSTTVGLECRVLLEGTKLADRRVNNPDQIGNAYMALHSVPHGKIEFLQEAFAPLREKRNQRNRKMVANINRLVEPHGIAISFDEVLALSQYARGGGVTERHMLYALAGQITRILGHAGTADFLESKLRLPLSPKLRDNLTQEDNPFFLYDLLGVLKAQLIEHIYVPAHEECLHIRQLRELASQTSALLCYAYLGDVGDSVTGDKKTQRFEDSYLEELFGVLREFGVDAITYMPSRNTKAQLARIMELCKSYGLWEISGEDINSPRQKFICEQLALPEYRHLIDSTWRLIRHEREQ